ncbi:(2Fe-2S)-binding protein [Pseudomonas sp. GL93]|uniref:Rieske 2Fe-2S domain-containing protein n=1 Tax=Pseudomonas sp. GL93 TaxID=2014741 RepID=UPI000E3119EF|nr:Rieske 2Fe-2S domain-containing protein [Pseudomonas sp. GL93]RFD28633.1 (2Fe-2S)-binding protein [Pseudomonas sp. GL93]
MTMPTSSDQTGQAAFYPSGWFVMCLASDLKPKTVLTLPFMGSEWVLYRTVSGAVRLVEPYCPHLGAHLGRGGRVEGENIVCPFHHFAFAADGQCVHTPSGIKPPNARLIGRSVQEWNGLILVWQGSGDQHTPWKLPELDLDGFCAPVRGRYQARGTLQNITENAVDLNHFAPIHGWMKALMQPPVAEGHQLNVRFTMEVLGLAVQMDIKLYGLGIMVAQMTQKRLGLHIQLMMTPTQIGPQQWALKDFMVLRVARFSGLPRWLGNALNAVLARAAYRFWFVPELKKDIQIWDHRNYDVRPKLTVNEGPIMVYRHWAAQFYPAYAFAPEQQAATDSLRQNNLSATTVGWSIAQDNQ